MSEPLTFRCENGHEVETDEVLTHCGTCKEPVVDVTGEQQDDKKQDDADAGDDADVRDSDPSEQEQLR